MSHKFYLYSEVLYPFGEYVKQLFQTENLNLLHHQLKGDEYQELFQVGMDSSTIFHDKFYKALRSRWLETFIHTYEDFVYNFISTIVLDENELLYQTTPTFRVHLPGNLAVGAFHKDKDFNHPTGEINFILPLTDMYGTNTVWAESSPDKGDFAPIEMTYGQVLQFDGNNCTHGNKVNTTPHTRVSLDFRVLPKAFYDPETAKSSVTKGTKFTLGNYYRQL